MEILQNYEHEGTLIIYGRIFYYLIIFHARGAHTSPKLTSSSLPHVFFFPNSRDSPELSSFSSHPFSLSLSVNAEKYTTTTHRSGELHHHHHHNLTISMNSMKPRNGKNSKLPRSTSLHRDYPTILSSEFGFEINEIEVNLNINLIPNSSDFC